MLKDKDMTEADRRHWLWIAASVILFSSLFVVYNLGYNRGYEAGSTDATKFVTRTILKNLDQPCTDDLLKSMKEGK